MKPIIYLITLIAAILSQSCATSVKQVREPAQIYQSSEEFYVYITPHNNLTLGVIAAWTLGNAKEHLELRKVNFFLSHYFNSTLPKNVPVLIPRKRLIQAPPIPSDFLEAFNQKQPSSTPRRRRPSPQKSTKWSAPRKNSTNGSNIKPKSAIRTNTQPQKSSSAPRKVDSEANNQVINKGATPKANTTKIETTTTKTKELGEVISALEKVINQEPEKMRSNSETVQQGKNSTQKAERKQESQSGDVATPNATSGKTDSTDGTKENETSKAKVQKNENGSNLEKQLFKDLFN